MTQAEILQTLRSLPDGAQVTLTVRVEDLVEALEAGDETPGRIVTTVWCAEHLGMSREWWATECREERIADAFQEADGSPWYLPLGVARAHLEEHRNRRTRTRSRRRGPRSQRRAS